MSGWKTVCCKPMSMLSGIGLGQYFSVYLHLHLNSSAHTTDFLFLFLFICLFHVSPEFVSSTFVLRLVTVVSFVAHTFFDCL